MRQFSTTGPWGRIAKWKIVSHIAAIVHGAAQRDAV
jgi:hypothetical protein